MTTEISATNPADDDTMAGVHEMNEMISARGPVKRYGDVTALDGLATVTWMSPPPT